MRSALIGWGIALIFSGVILVAMTQAISSWDAERAEEQAQKSQLQRIEDQLQRSNGLLEAVFQVKIKDEFTTHSMIVTASAYTARAEECDESPETTADMTPSRVGLLAVSRDLLQYRGLKYGDIVMLIDHGEFLGVFIISDTMHPRWKHRVDILHGNVAAARLFGVKEGVLLVRVIGDDQ